jgi:hypothetical protein
MMLGCLVHRYHHDATTLSQQDVDKRGAAAASMVQLVRHVGMRGSSVPRIHADMACCCAASNAPGMPLC